MKPQIMKMSESDLILRMVQLRATLTSASPAPAAPLRNATPSGQCTHAVCMHAPPGNVVVPTHNSPFPVDILVGSVPFANVQHQVQP